MSTILLFPLLFVLKHLTTKLGGGILKSKMEAEDDLKKLGTLLFHVQHIQISKSIKKIILARKFSWAKIYHISNHTIRMINQYNHSTHLYHTVHHGYDIRGQELSLD